MLNVSNDFIPDFTFRSCLTYFLLLLAFPFLFDTIRGRQWKFIGHLLREEDGIERHIIETPMEGKRARGRQKIAFLDWMRKRANAQDGTELGEMARNSNGWRRIKPP